MHELNITPTFPIDLLYDKIYDIMEVSFASIRGNFKLGMRNGLETNADRIPIEFILV